MHKILHLTIAFTLFTCCNTSYAQKWSKCRGKDIAGEKIYKHYTGNLGDKKIALDLRFGFCGGSNYGGTTYYTIGEAGTTLFYIGEPDSFDVNIILDANEQPADNKLWEANNNREDRNNLPKWTFKITNNKLEGTWVSGDKKEKRDISLTEDYKKSVPFDLYTYSDKSPKTWLLYPKPSLAVKKEDADFITRAQLNFLTGTKEHPDNWTEYLQSLNGNDSFGRTTFMPVYNDNGFLVLEKNTVRNFANKYTDRYAYLCLDILRKRILTLNDIIHADNKKLPQLLETALRKKYNLENDKKLSTYFLFDKVPVSDNIMLTEQGINFCYDFNQLVVKQADSRPAVDQIKVFLSYAQLTDILQDDFKKRLRD